MSTSFILKAPRSVVTPKFLLLAGVTAIVWSEVYDDSIFQRKFRDCREQYQTIRYKCQFCTENEVFELHHLLVPMQMYALIGHEIVHAAEAKSRCSWLWWLLKAPFYNRRMSKLSKWLMLLDNMFSRGQERWRLRQSSRALGYWTEEMEQAHKKYLNRICSETSNEIWKIMRANKDLPTRIDGAHLDLLEVLARNADL